MNYYDGSKICAVVVTYLPQIESLTNLLRLLLPQVACIVVVDNSPDNDLSVSSLCSRYASSSLQLIRFGENLGIAKAFNVGIEFAMTSGATHVLLSDQDSEPATDMVDGLLRAEANLRQMEIKVAAVGPSFTNINSGDLFPFHVQVKGHPLHGRRSATHGEPHINALNLISSGTLISADAIKAVGLMREDFFIDSVDTEWCYRARAKGYAVYGTGWATMRHRMGDSNLRVWYFGWVKANAHSPIRIYYQIRNLVRLHYLGYKGVRWKIRSFFSMAAIFYCHVLFGREKLTAFRMVMRGLADGIRGKMGMFKP